MIAKLPRGVGRPGIPIDSQGGNTVDPTKNVEDLVKALEVTLEKLRQADSKRVDDLSALETKRQDGLRNALDRRLTALSDQRRQYEQRIEHLRRDYEKEREDIKSDFGKQIAAILQAQADKNALLLSSGVDKLGASTSDRLALVEKNQYVTGGASAARDPALDRKLDDISAMMAVLQRGGNRQEDTKQGQTQLFGFIVGALIAGGAFVGIIEFILRHG